jgi:hypothetical protein
MHTAPKEPIHKQAKQLTHNQVVHPSVRRRSRIYREDSELNFTDRLVDLVCNEYPVSKEEASVLISRVWNLIDQEITSELFDGSSSGDLKERIAIVSAFYDLAVQRLRDLDKPLLKYGAVADFYSTL